MRPNLVTIVLITMNILLFDKKQICKNLVRISGRHLRHMQNIQDLQVGDSLRIGQINGMMGSGIITQLDNQSATIEFNLDTPPPPPLPSTLILALPRPKMLRRVIQTVASMGIKHIHLINSARVEKSFWQSPFLTDESLHEQLILGLEQAVDTVLPKIYQHKLFKPFVEDKLKDSMANSKALVGHPTATQTCPINVNEPTTLIIGPEGGFIPYEVEKFEEQGVEAVTIGDRILRVETAVPALISRLYPS